MSDNIQVIVRCRARNERELSSKSPNIIGLPNDVYSLDEPYISVNGEHSSVISTNFSSSRRLSGSGSGKVFKVDQVYGPNADQALIFENVAIPLFHKFVTGMNVTMLAYGQTGSGKTYSMCGDLTGEHAGIIPRVLTKLFSVLSGDYFVKLSCVELYQEELRDLISDDQDLNIKSRLRLISDNTKKAATIQNLTEVHIDSCEMGFKILQKCLNKRKTSATKLNDHSSRSHTIFTINLYRQTNLSDSMSDYCVSKMNLVDLAGSEDINKSGATNERAREAGSINQSLLTLGKVINSLSEGNEPKHIPYRESKLTRLLQGSIGGKTKTALIATISPAKINTHETLSTLNYASKAKNIKNLPQSTFDSEMVLKKVLVNELSTQIARVTRDLMATKDKEGGIRMSMQNYNEYNLNLSSMESDLKEKDAEVKSLNARLEKKEKEIEDLRQQLDLVVASEDDLRAQCASERKEVGSLNLQLSLLKEKYQHQNEKLTQFMLINISDIEDALSKILRSIMDDKSQINEDLISLKSNFTVQIGKLRKLLGQKAEEIKTVTSKELAILGSLLMKNLDLNPFIEELSRYSCNEEAEILEENNKIFTQESKEALNPESAIFKAIIEKVDRQYLLQTSTLKEAMVENIVRIVDDMFKNNFQIFSDSMKLTTTDLLSTGRDRIALLSTQNADVVHDVSTEIQTKSNSMKQTVSTMKRHLSDEIESTTTIINENLKSKLLEPLSQLADVSMVENSTVKQIEDTMVSTKQSLENIGNSAIANHEHTKGSFDKFRTILANLEISPNSVIRSVPASPKRSPIRSPLSNSAKRRKPMSPLKSENGLFKSQIPQLSNSTK